MKHRRTSPVLAGFSYALGLSIFVIMACCFAEDVLAINGVIDNERNFDIVAREEFTENAFEITLVDDDARAAVAAATVDWTVLIPKEDDVAVVDPLFADDVAEIVDNADNEEDETIGAETVTSEAEPEPSEAEPVPSEAEPEPSEAEPVPSEAEPYFANTLFIGDSRTDGLHINTGEKNAVFYAVKGLAVNNIFDEEFIKIPGKKGKVKLLDALKGSKYRKIYISLGVNELGWVSETSFINQYTEVVSTIKEAMPDSQIVVQAILPITKKRSSSDKVYTNEKVTLYNELIEKMCADLDVSYGNVVPAVADAEGYLPEEGAVDGIHLKKSYYEKWLQYIEDEEI